MPWAPRCAPCMAHQGGDHGIQSAGRQLHPVDQDIHVLPVSSPYLCWCCVIWQTCTAVSLNWQEATWLLHPHGIVFAASSFLLDSNAEFYPAVLLAYLPEWLLMHRTIKVQ